MKVSKRDVLLLVGFIGILAAVCSYFLVFKPTMEKADALEEENMQLTQRIADLSGKMANKGTYEEETEQMRQDIEDIFQLFPVDVREEDAILLAINQELIAPMDIDGVVIDPLEDVPFLDEAEEEDVEHTYEIDEVEKLEDQEGTQEAQEAAVAEAEGNGAPSLNPFGLKTRKVTINYDVSYEGLKRSIKNLCMQTDRMTIDEVIVAYDETTGLLQGSTTMDMFCVPGQEGKEYVAPDFNYVLLGTDNIFGTIVVRGEAGMPDIEGEGDEAEAAEE